MAILVTSDWQLDDAPANEYRHLALQGFKWPEVSTIIVLGDLTEEKDNHSARLVNLIVGRIASLSRIAPVYVLMGNHDYVDLHWPFFRFLSKLKQVRYIEDVAYCEIEGLERMFIPHTRWPLPEIYGPIHDAVGQYAVFTHNTFEGAQGNHGKLEGHPLPNGLKCKIVSGDVHIPHTVGPVTYVGSPYTVDFGDDWEPRMLLIDGKKATSIKVPGPQKRLIEIDARQFKAALDLAMDKGRMVAGDMLRVRVHLNADTVMHWPQISDRIRAWCVHHKIAPTGGIEPIMPQVLRESMRALEQIVGPKRDGEIIDAFAKARKLDERTTATGHNLADNV